MRFHVGSAGQYRSKDSRSGRTCYRRREVERGLNLFRVGVMLSVIVYLKWWVFV